MKFPESLGADPAPDPRAATGPRGESLGATGPCLLLKPGLQPRHLVSCLGFPDWLVATYAFSLSLIFLSLPPHLCWPSVPFSECLEEPSSSPGSLPPITPCLSVLFLFSPLTPAFSYFPVSGGSWAEWGAGECRVPFLELAPIFLG